MRAVAVGDMFVSENDFRRVIEPSDLFQEYQGFSWKTEVGKEEKRALIRKIETEGPTAYELPNEIREAFLKADCIFVHLCPVPADIIEQAENLKYIISLRGGLENLDVEAAKKKGVRIIHCPMHNARAVAEYTIGLMICETRNMARADRALREGIWREEYPNSEGIMEIRSCTIGLIGFGTIGRLVADYLQAFGPRIYVYSPHVDDDAIKAAGCIPVTKEKLLKDSDIISLHGRLNKNDPPVIGKNELAMMKNTTYLINTARAALVDMDALYDALKNREIRGAAIDVYPYEPIGQEYPLLELDNCTLTNHRGGDTIESYRRAPELVLHQLEEFLETGHTRYLV